MKKFKVNPLVPGDAAHVRGKIFKKGVVYDPAEMKLAEAFYQRMMKLRYSRELSFFVEAE